MARTFGDQPGGILSLDALIEEHSEAIEYDLIALGLRLRQLGTAELTWNDLKAVVKWSPASSALTLATRPDDHRWQLEQHLLADMADSLRWLVWSKTTDARNGRNMPQRITRPGVKPTGERIGSATKISDMHEFLGW